MNRRRRLHRLLVTAAFAFLAACSAPSQPPETPPQPEASSGWTPKPGWGARRFAVAAANPLAADAGYKVLREGGTAVDAAVAVQMVLALVEPQASGLGGGAFLLLHDGRATEAFDGRETAPAEAREDLFLDAAGKPLPFRRAMVGGRSVGVPGALAMLELAHQRHGRLRWARLFEPAIALAENGFPVGARMRELLLRDAELKRDPAASRYFYDEKGEPWPVGHLLRNPKLAAAFRAAAAQGTKALAEGDFARAMVRSVRGHPTNPGTLSLADLAAYRPVIRDALCFEHRVLARTFRICGVPPPSSGAITIGQIFGVLERVEAGTGGPSDARWLHLYNEASRLAFADRAMYIADPAFVPQPGGDGGALLAPAYLTQRARLVSADKRIPAPAPAGRPDTANAALAPMAEQPEYGTSQVSIIDGDGRALSMTTTIEFAWGSHIMVNRGVGLTGGFLLNNELTDFSFEPADANGRKVANRVEPGKRPRSSMSPTLVFDKATGQVVMTVGSSGGALILHTTAKTIWGVLDGGLDAQKAIDLPNFGSLGEGDLLLEPGRFQPAVVDRLRQLGDRPQQSEIPSGIHAITRSRDGLFGGADPRREGMVAGD